MVKPAIAIASPMLLLREGTRNITLSFSFSGRVDTPLFNNVTYYLSTKTDWLKVNGGCRFDALTGLKIISISVDPVQQPIEPFLKAPDGLNNTWPMFKIEFNTLPDAITIPVIESLTIGVDVSDVTTFQLYNDYGAISNKAPYQPFGPTPLFNANFIIGNNEIFSKPIQSLLITLNWDNLPDDFASYYQLYNDYLAGELNPPDKSHPGHIARLWSSLLLWLHNTHRPVPVVPKPVFSNASFTADFKLLQQHTWMEISMTDNPAPVVPPVKPVNYLFNHKVEAAAPAATGMGNVSSFNYSAQLPWTADPSIQNIPLKYTDASLSGFMKIALTGNPYGFGSPLYPQLVTQIALYNAWILYNKDTEIAMYQAANLPFAPKLTSFMANYCASQVYHFDTTSTDYPFQCFVCSPFVNHLIYDN